MEDLNRKLTCLRIFIDMDHLVIGHLNNMHTLMQDLTENIPTKLSTKVGDKELGVHFIEIITEIDKFLKDYKSLKDTWGVTAPSPVLDDEK